MLEWDLVVQHNTGRNDTLQLHSAFFLQDSLMTPKGPVNIENDRVVLRIDLVVEMMMSFPEKGSNLLIKNLGSKNA